MSIEDGIEQVDRPGRGRYRRRSLAEKRQIVELCLKPGASVAGIALARGVNANLVRKWIGKVRAGEWGGAPVPLLPVSLRNEPLLAVGAGEGHGKGHIEIDLPGARLRLVGRVDAEALRLVLGCLSR
jgi:transposase